MNVTALETGVFADGAQVRSSGWVLIQHALVSLQNGTCGQRGRHAQREMGEDGEHNHRGRGWSEASRPGHRGPPERRRDSPESQQRNGTRKLGFGLSTSRAERTIPSAVSSHLGHCTLSQQLEREPSRRSRVTQHSPLLATRCRSW